MWSSWFFSWTIFVGRDSVPLCLTVKTAGQTISCKLGWNGERETLFLSSLRLETWQKRLIPQIFYSNALRCNSIFCPTIQTNHYCRMPKAASGNALQKWPKGLLKKNIFSEGTKQENISCFGFSHNLLSWSDPQQASQIVIISCEILIFFSSNCVQPWFVSSPHLASRGRCVLLAAYPRPFDWSHHLHFPLSHCVWYHHHHPFENWALHIPSDWPSIFSRFLYTFWMEEDFGWR